MSQLTYKFPRIIRRTLTNSKLIPYLLIHKNTIVKGFIIGHFGLSEAQAVWEIKMCVISHISSKNIYI